MNQTFAKAKETHMNVGTDMLIWDSHDHFKYILCLISLYNLYNFSLQVH